jgi:hypothetical protein
MKSLKGKQRPKKNRKTEQGAPETAPQDMGIHEKSRLHFVILT